MGQLVAFEQDLKETQSDREMKNVHDFMPTDDQEKLTDNFQLEAFETFGPNLEDRTPSPKPKINTPSTGSAGVGKSMSSSPFVLKLPMGRNIKGKLVCAGEFFFFVCLFVVVVVLGGRREGEGTFN